MNNRTKLPMTVIIPTYKRPVALKRTLEILHSFAYQPEEVVIIDQTEYQFGGGNHQLLMTLYPNGKYIHMDVPSLTASRNVGIRAASHDVIVFMDDDVDVNENTLYEIDMRMRDDRIAMIGVLDEYGNKAAKFSNLSYIFGMKSYKNRKIGYVTSGMLGRYPADVRGEVPTMWAMGYCFAVRKHLVEKWDLHFDEQLVGYAYAEDLDFTYAYYKCAVKENLECILSEKITVKHLGTKEYRIPNKSIIYKYVINRTYLGYKHHTGIKGQLMILWNNVGYFLVMLVGRTRPMAVLGAQIKCEKVRKQLKQGILVNTDYI